MNPADIALIISSIESLIAYLFQLRANGQITDEQLDTAVASSNSQTRTLIQQFLQQEGSSAS